jgi:hypothetical protein
MSMAVRRVESSGHRERGERGTMTNSKAEDGKTWVVSNLLSLTDTVSVPLESFRWERRAYARLDDPYLLVLVVNGKEIIIILSSLDLTVCQDDPVVQMRVQKRLKGLVNSLHRSWKTFD